MLLKVSMGKNLMQSVWTFNSIIIVISTAASTALVALLRRFPAGGLTGVFLVSALFSGVFAISGPAAAPLLRSDGPGRVSIPPPQHPLTIDATGPPFFFHPLVAHAIY